MNCSNAALHVSLNIPWKLHIFQINRISCMKHYILSVLAVLFFNISFAQNKDLPEPITDRYAISKNIPEDARSIILSIRLKNKDSKNHQGSLMVDIRNQGEQRFYQNEKKILRIPEKQVSLGTTLFLKIPGSIPSGILIQMCQVK